MTATPLLFDVYLTVHVNSIVFSSISCCSFSIIGMQVAGKKLEMLATSLGTHASFCTQGLHGPLLPLDAKRRNGTDVSTGSIFSVHIGPMHAGLHGSYSFLEARLFPVSLGGDFGREIPLQAH